MFNFLNKFPFLKKYFQKDDSSKVAKNRLQLVLIHDRATISPQLMEVLRYELIRLISRYMVINEDDIDIGLDKKDGTIILSANIPILKIKSDLEKGTETEEEITPLEIPSKSIYLEPSRVARKTRTKYTSYRLARRKKISRKK